CTLRRLQLEILKYTGLHASIGAASTKVAAAIASRLARPNGLRFLAPGSESSFLASLPIEVLDVINHIDAGDLRKRGISTIVELRRVLIAALECAYGSAVARKLWQHSRAPAVRDIRTPCD